MNGNKDENLENRQSSMESERVDTFSKSSDEINAAKEAARIKEERELEGGYSTTHESYVPDTEKEIPDYYASPKVSIRKILKYVVIGLVIAVYALIFYRIYLQNNSGVKIVNQLISNTETVKAFRDTYEKGESFDVYSQNLTSYTLVLETDADKKPTKTTNIIYNEYSQSKNYYGTFYVTGFLYYEDSEQVVITLRYNRSALNALKEDYKLSDIPSEPFFFTLDDGKQFYDEYEYVSDKKFTYYYRRIIFNSVSLEDIKSLSLNIYYVGDSEDYYAPLDYIPIYDSRVPLEKVKNVAALEYITSGLKKKPIANVN